MAAAVSTMWSAVTCERIGVMSTRLNRRVTCRVVLPTAGLTALQLPLAGAANSPPGALSGGAVSTVEGGFGSVM